MKIVDNFLCDMLFVYKYEYLGMFVDSFVVEHSLEGVFCYRVEEEKEAVE